MSKGDQDTLELYVTLMGAKPVIEGNLESSLGMFALKRLDLVAHDMRGIIRAAQLVIDQIDKLNAEENA